MSADLIVAGEDEPVAALGSMLAERGLEVEVCSVQGSGSAAELLASALVRLEQLADELSPRAILSVGDGPVASAAALVAGKVPCALISCTFGAAADQLASDERRALEVLSDLDLKLSSDDGAALAAPADQIVDWLSLRPA